MTLLDARIRLQYRHHCCRRIDRCRRSCSCSMRRRWTMKYRCHHHRLQKICKTIVANNRRRNIPLSCGRPRHFNMRVAKMRIANNTRSSIDDDERTYTRLTSLKILSLIYRYISSRRFSCYMQLLNSFDPLRPLVDLDEYPISVNKSVTRIETKPPKYV